MGKMMEQGPVLVITFNSQQILAVKDSSGKVIEGSEDKVIHDWRAMQCADQVSAGYRIQIYLVKKDSTGRKFDRTESVCKGFDSLWCILHMMKGIYTEVIVFQFQV